MSVVQVLPQEWDTVSAAVVSERIGLGSPLADQVLGGKGAVPPTYLFKTREGGMGVLQFTHVNDDPRGVKIRYMLVQTADSGAAGQPSSAPARRVMAQAPFVARLAEGEVELVALSHYPSANERGGLRTGERPTRAPSSRRPAAIRRWTSECSLSLCGFAICQPTRPSQPGKWSLAAHGPKESCFLQTKKPAGSW